MQGFKLTIPLIQRFEIDFQRSVNSLNIRFYLQRSIESFSCGRSVKVVYVAKSGKFRPTIAQHEFWLKSQVLKYPSAKHFLVEFVFFLFIASWLSGDVLMNFLGPQTCGISGIKSHLSRTLSHFRDLNTNNLESTFHGLLDFTWDFGVGDIWYFYY